MAASPSGIFDNTRCRLTQTNIIEGIRSLHHLYTHNKLVAELGFGFWRYLFSVHQFRVAGQSLLAIFPAKPKSTPTMQYNANYIFVELAKLNDLRNRIAHHEPICFTPGLPVIETTYVRQHYNLVLQLFRWMQIDEAALLYGLDHIITVCNEIDNL